MAESRKQVRGHTSDYFVVYNRTNGELLGRLRNLTTEGAMLISDESMAVPAVVQCRMILPDIIEGCREMYFDMESKWCQENKDANWYETGYKFVNVGDLSRQVIERLVTDWMTCVKEPDTDPARLR